MCALACSHLWKLFITGLLLFLLFFSFVFWLSWVLDSVSVKPVTFTRCHTWYLHWKCPTLDSWVDQQDLLSSKMPKKISVFSQINLSRTNPWSHLGKTSLYMKWVKKLFSQSKPGHVKQEKEKRWWRRWGFRREA